MTLALPAGVATPQGANCYSVETSQAAAMEGAQGAMRFMAEGLAVPADPAMNDELLRWGFTLWRGSENDERAFWSFRQAGRCGQAGRLALVSLAAASPNTQIARRALAALAHVGVRDAESCVALLLYLLERDDPMVQSLASRLLVDCALHDGPAPGMVLGTAWPKTPALQRAIVERALSNWPQDNENLCFSVFACGSSGDNVWWSARLEQLRWAWVAIATRTGDRAVVKRLLEWCREKDGAAAVPGLRLAAQCLALVSSRVDADTARDLHSVFMPLFLQRRGQGTAGPTGPSGCPTTGGCAFPLSGRSDCGMTPRATYDWGQAIANVVLDVFAIVPPEL